jgi:hypothetical protein
VGSDDRLVLLCGVTAHRETRALVAETLARTSDNAAAARDLAEALGDSRPAGVLVIGGARTPDYQLRLVAGGAPAHQLRQPPLQPPSHPTPSPPVRAVGRWLGSLLGLALLALVITAGLTVASESASPTREAVSAQPRPAAPVDRVDLVSPEIAVRLGPSAANVVDLAIGDDSIYTLDVVEHAVRAFPLDARETLPTPDSLVARSGASIGAAPGRSLGTPVAIQYVGNALLVIDDGRSVVQIGKDRQLALRDVPSSRTWQSVGALGADASGALLFLDSGSRRLLAYPGARQRVLDPPRVIVDSAIQPALPFDRVADLVCLPDAIVAHLEDGSLQVIGGDGSISPLVVRPPDGRAPVVKSITTDRGGGLFAADPANARILQLTSDGDVIRELRDPALAGVRQIQSSLDGRHVFGLVASGVLVFDTPAL